MIQIYSPGNNAYDKNGNAVLHPISCQVSAELNGSWMLELEAPIDADNIWRLIEVGAVIKAPSFNGEQLFRIRQTEKKDSGVTATAEPIFLDAVGDCFLLDIRPTNKNGQQALDMILAPNDKYTGSSDITRTSTAYYVRKNALEAIAGEDNCFIARWGGEILYNNYQIIINERVGGDYGASLLYGKNIPVDGMSEAVNMEGVVTRIIPKAYNGYLLAGSSPWVDSPIINAYPTIMTKVVEYDNIRLASDVEGDDTEGLIICDNLTQLRAALQQAAEEEFANGIDKPAVSISADMVMLSNTVEYRDYKDLEQVSLGDTIHCKHNRLGIITDARIVGIVYDCTRKAVTAVTIGEPSASFMDRVASTVSRAEKAIKPGGTVRAEQVQGFIDGVYAQLRVQNTVARRQDARAILFEDLDPASPTYGALAIGTQGWQISKTRTADDRDWVWSTAATASGIVADAITTGTLDAIDITGVNISGSNITGTTIQGNTITGGTISGTTITGSTISTTGDIDEDDTTQGTVVLQDGYVYAQVGTGTTIDRGVLNGEYVQVSNKTGSTINSYANMQSIGRIALSDGTYGFKVNETPGVVGIGSGASSTNNRAQLNAANGALNLRGSNATTQAIDINANNRAVMIAGTGSSQMGIGFQTNRYGYVYDGSKYVWATNYVSGETLTYEQGIFAGHVTNSTKAIDFFIPTNASAEGRTATITVPSNCSVRTPSGYINSSQYLSPTGITVTATCFRNGIRVRFASSSAYTNVSNNQPVAVAGSFTITFTA